MFAMDINRGVEDCRRIPGAVLLDVRNPQEYRQGHIPESINIPLRMLDSAENVVENRDAALYVYCHSGVRSRQAAAQLKEMGYTNVNNIGGIADYSGKVGK